MTIVSCDRILASGRRQAIIVGHALSMAFCVAENRSCCAPLSTAPGMSVGRVGPQELDVD